MSNKATCPACGSHTSAIWQAWQDDDPCPTCGLSAAAAAEVEAASRRGADEALVESAAKAMQRADVAERRVRQLEATIRQIRHLIDEPDPETFSDMAPGWQL